MAVVQLETLAIRIMTTLNNMVMMTMMGTTILILPVGIRTLRIAAVLRETCLWKTIKILTVQTMKRKATMTTVKVQLR